MIRIDAHQHFWDRSPASLEQFDHSWQEAEPLAKICRSFLPEDLQPLIETAEIDRTIFVQTQHNVAENRWALQLADQHRFIAGVVGWIDLTSPDCEDQLIEFKDHPKFVGVRHVVQDEPDDDFIISENVSQGLSVLEKHGVPYDLLFYTKHLKHALTVARKFPDLPFVIDHLSKPSIKTGTNTNEFRTWKVELQNAAQCENVFCKLSGLVTEADWSNWNVEDLRPFADWAIECFGPERMMFGSDWPVCLLAASYSEVATVAEALIGRLSEVERGRIMGGTAIQFYSLT